MSKRRAPASAEAIANAITRKKKQNRDQATLRWLRETQKKYGLGLIPRGSELNIQTFGKTRETADSRQLANRKAARYYGEGGYWGRQIGGLFGRADLGDKLGDLAGSAVRSLVPHGNTMMDAAVAAGNVMQGRGAYDMVDANDLVRSVAGARGFEVPTFAPIEDGAAVRVSHREYLGDVYGPSDGSFTNLQYSINPGMAETFPWLAQCAQNYDEYDLHQCMFTFRSTTTDIGSSSNGQCGTIIMATQYNASDVGFQDKQSMMEYDGAMSSKTTEHQIHGVECDPAKLSGSPGKYIRTGPVRNQDLKSYDHATLNVAVTGIPSGYFGQPLGELWISYTVTLRKPKFFSARGYDTLRDVFVYASPNTAMTSTPLASLPSWLTGYYNSIGAYIDKTLVPAGAIVFPDNFSGALRFLVNIATTGAGLNPGFGIVVQTSPNISIVNDLYGTTSGSDTATYYSLPQPSGGTAMIVYDVLIKPRPAGVAVPKTYFSFTVNGTMSTWQGLSIDISQLNNNFSANSSGNLMLVDANGNFVTP